MTKKEIEEILAGKDLWYKGYKWHILGISWFPRNMGCEIFVRNAKLGYEDSCGWTQENVELLAQGYRINRWKLADEVNSINKLNLN